MTDTLERILQGIHIAIMADVGMTLTNAQAKELLGEITELAASSVRLRREVERLEKQFETAKAWIPQWVFEDEDFDWGFDDKEQSE